MSSVCPDGGKPNIFFDEVECPWAKMITPKWSPDWVYQHYGDDEEVRRTVHLVLVLLVVVVSSWLYRWCWDREPKSRFTNLFAVWPLGFIVVATGVAVSWIVHILIASIPVILVVIVILILIGLCVRVVAWVGACVCVPIGYLFNLPNDFLCTKARECCSFLNRALEDENVEKPNEKVGPEV